MISILHPSRGRPQKSFETCKKWIVKAVTEVQLILSIDENDPLRNDYLTLFEDVGLLYNGMNAENCGVYMLNNRSAVDAINHAAFGSKGDILIVVSDDTDCPDRWDELLLKEVDGKTDWILKTQDGIQPWIITMPVMDRAYYNRTGYIYHPDYLHMFCDTELTCVADLTARKITSGLIFPHDHYSTGKSIKDQVSEKADKTWAQGEALFLSRYKKDFDLVNPPGKINNSEMLNWIKSKKV